MAFDRERLAAARLKAENFNTFDAFDLTRTELPAALDALEKAWAALAVAVEACDELMDVPRAPMTSICKASTLAKVQQARAALPGKGATDA